MKLHTRYGVVEDNGDLGDLSEDAFNQWADPIKNIGKYSKDQLVRAYKHFITNKLITRYGPIEESGELGKLNEEMFLKWAKEYRKNNTHYPESQEDWVLLYKRTISREYAEKQFNLSDRIE